MALSCLARSRPGEIRMLRLPRQAHNHPISSSKQFCLCLDTGTTIISSHSLVIYARRSSDSPCCTSPAPTPRQEQARRPTSSTDSDLRGPLLPPTAFTPLGPVSIHLLALDRWPGSDRFNTPHCAIRLLLRKPSFRLFERQLASSLPAVAPRTRYLDIAASQIHI